MLYYLINQSSGCEPKNLEIENFCHNSKKERYFVANYGNTGSVSMELVAIFPVKNILKPLKSFMSQIIRFVSKENQTERSTHIYYYVEAVVHYLDFYL